MKKSKKVVNKTAGLLAWHITISQVGPWNEKSLKVDRKLKERPRSKQWHQRVRTRRMIKVISHSISPAARTRLAIESWIWPRQIRIALNWGTWGEISSVAQRAMEEILYMRFQHPKVPKLDCQASKVREGLYSRLARAKRIFSKTSERVEIRFISKTPIFLSNYQSITIRMWLQVLTLFLSQLSAQIQGLAAEEFNSLTRGRRWALLQRWTRVSSLQEMLIWNRTSLSSKRLDSRLWISPLISTQVYQIDPLRCSIKRGKMLAPQIGTWEVWEISPLTRHSPLLSMQRVLAIGEELGTLEPSWTSQRLTASTIRLTRVISGSGLVYQRRQEWIRISLLPINSPWDRIKWLQTTGPRWTLFLIR